jgi:hypothetical protein
MITASMRERDRQVVDNLADFYINLDMRGTSLLDFADPEQVVAKGYDPPCRRSRDGSRPMLTTLLRLKVSRRKRDLGVYSVSRIGLEVFR